ncbi:MAG: DUF1868 domain-containing protein [Synechococcales cyanobacterium RM1_1_8]|nr:DUF1868 domain-containing protein [Synechococcales cyanobacterium RM1_1_8]
MDDQFQPYVNRVIGLTHPDHYEQQLSVIHASPKYQHQDGRWQAVPFPGCSIISPPSGEDPINQDFYQQLQAVLVTLQAELPAELLIPLPQESLHMTLADLLWAENFSQAAQAEGFGEQLNQEIGQVLQGVPDQQTQPIRFQVVGLMVMPRALGLCLVPETEASYERIRSLRRSLYQQPGLLGLGIEQQYNFTAHITLGYFGQIPPDLDAKAWAQRLVQLNQSRVVALPEFAVQRAELRQFDDMTIYRRQPDWPVLDFEDACYRTGIWSSICTAHLENSASPPDHR